MGVDPEPLVETGVVHSTAVVVKTSVSTVVSGELACHWRDVLVTLPDSHIQQVIKVLGFNFKLWE